MHGGGWMIVKLWRWWLDDSEGVAVGAVGSIKLEGKIRGESE